MGRQGKARVIQACQIESHSNHSPSSQTPPSLAPINGNPDSDCGSQVSSFTLPILTVCFCLTCTVTPLGVVSPLLYNLCETFSSLHKSLETLTPYSQTIGKNLLQEAL